MIAQKQLYLSSSDRSVTLLPIHTQGSDGTVRVWILENPSLASTFAPDGSNMSNPGSGISASQGISLGIASHAAALYPFFNCLHPGNRHS